MRSANTRRRKRPRKYVAMREKLAAALSMLLPASKRDLLREHLVPAKTVIGMFDQDHVVLHAFGGPDRWWNLTPMLRPAHRKKAAIDTAIVAKTKRIERAQQRHNKMMSTKIALLSPSRPDRRKRKIPTRPFQKGHRPLRGRRHNELHPTRCFSEIGRDAAVD